MPRDKSNLRHGLLPQRKKKTLSDKCNARLTLLLVFRVQMIGDAFVGVVFVRNVSAAILWAGIMPWLDNVGSVRSIVIVAGGALIAVLLIPILLLRWGRTGRIATAAKYRHYSLAATPPAILERMFGAKTDA